MKVKQQQLWICLSLFLMSINPVYSQGTEVESPPVELEEVTVITRVSERHLPNTQRNLCH